MPLFLVFLFLLHYIEQTAVSETRCITLTNFDNAGDTGDVILMKGSSLLMCVVREVLFERLKSVQILIISL
jgi:hypothetical protein